MVIVIIDSGLSDRYDEKNEIIFPFCSESLVPKVVSGHGTAIFNIINTKCSKFAEIINFRILNIESGVDERTLIDALLYINQNVHADIINLSLGISECDDLEALRDVCLKITNNGTVIVSAFDNSGSISYPAAFENVIGVVSGKKCNKIDDFEYYDDSVVNIGAKGTLQRLVWDNPSFVFLSGNSFACAHTTAKIAEMMVSSNVKLSKNMILKKFSEIAVKKYPHLKDFVPQQLPFDIQNAVVFPFSKEIQSLLRYKHLLNFNIVDVYDTKYSARIGSTSTHLMKDNCIDSYIIKNIDKINYDSFDTFILGHMDEMSMALKEENFVEHFITCMLNHGKKIFSFDDVSRYGFIKSDNLYYPSITKEDLPPNRLGMLYRITVPVIGVFGTSSKQGKFTTQLKIREVMLEEGYSVGEIGTEPSSQLYGMDYVFPMGYNSTVYINNDEIINYINTVMYDISQRKKDIIIVGSQSGTIPYDYGNISQFPILQYSFLLGTMPDCIVLCINLFDSYEYIHRTIAVLESLSNGKVIAMATIPFVTKENTMYSLESQKNMMSYEDFTNIQSLFNNEFNMPLYNIASDSDMKRMTQQIIQFFLEPQT